MSLRNFFGLLGIAGIDIDRHHLKARAAQFAFQRIERRHFLAAGHAPGGPQVEQHGAAAEGGERQFLAGGVLEGEVGDFERALRDVDGRHLAARERRDFLGQSHRRPAGRIAARIASEGRKPVYPRQPEAQAGNAAGHDQGKPLIAGAGRRTRGIGHDRRKPLMVVR